MTFDKHSGEHLSDDLLNANCILHCDMHSTITSYLLQTGKGVLPHIGFFDSRYQPAVTDIINNQMIPPGDEIIFSEETLLTSPDLVKYIATKKNIPESDAALLLDEFCKEWKEKIDHGETLCFDAFGCLKKNESGITFSSENNYSYYTPVAATTVRRQHTEHDVLVGDTHTTSGAMLHYYNGEKVCEKRNWRIWALVLFIIAVTGLIFSFYGNKLSTGAFGNRSTFTIETVGETHFELSE